MLETCSPSASGLFRFVHVYGNCQSARTAKSVMHTHRFYFKKIGVLVYSGNKVLGNDFS